MSQLVDAKSESWNYSLLTRKRALEQNNQQRPEDKRTKTTGHRITVKRRKRRTTRKRRGTAERKKPSDRISNVKVRRRNGCKKALQEKKKEKKKEYNKKSPDKRTGNTVSGKKKNTWGGEGENRRTISHDSEEEWGKGLGEQKKSDKSDPSKQKANCKKATNSEERNDCNKDGVVSTARKKGGSKENAVNNIRDDREEPKSAIKRGSKKRKDQLREGKRHQEINLNVKEKGSYYLNTRS